MHAGHIAIATLATLGGGIVLGLAANPTLRTLPEFDWRTRYRAQAAAPEPARQPGVTYYGDGSGAWGYGRPPDRFGAGLAPLRSEPIPALAVDDPAWRDGSSADLPPLPDLAPLPDDAALAAAERAAAQAAVADALVRSAPAADDQWPPPQDEAKRDVDRADGPDPYGG